MGDSWSLGSWRGRRTIDNRVGTFVMKVKRAPVHLGDSSVSSLSSCGRMSCAFSTVSSGVNDVTNQVAVAVAVGLRCGLTD